MSIKKTVTSQATPDIAVTPIDGRYLIHEKIGDGGMGVVFQATDRLSERLLAFKQMSLPTWHYQVDDDTEGEIAEALRLALAHELKTLVSLRHPNIVSVLDYGFDDERRPYFTMDYLMGAKNILAAGAELDEPGKVNLLQQMLQALAYLHRHGILHHNLKPTNVLVTNGTVRLLDFGLATTQKSALQTAGSIPYIAPEVWNEQAHTEAADLYATGVMAFELFAGRHPFEINSHQFIDQVLDESPDLSLLHASPAVTAVVATLIEKAQDNRFPSAKACLAAFSQAVDQPIPAESIDTGQNYLQATPFVGRTAEKGLLLNALESARQGRGSAWLVSGERGVGKTRLLDEIGTHALVQGALVLRGQGVENVRGTPLQLWQNALRRLVLTAPLNNLAVEVLQTLIPDVGQLVQRTVPPGPKLEAAANRQRLISTITGLFSHQTQWILLILEDLQWVQEELDILQRLTNMAPKLPLLIIGSCRSDEQSTLAAQLPLIETVRLNPLSRAEIAELSTHMLGRAGKQPELLSLLQAKTKGNAFLLVQALAEKANHSQESPHRNQ